jgi:uncharacterized cupin superfamily protein
MAKPPITNLRELKDFQERSHGDRYASRHVTIGVGLGARKLGYNLTEIPPGKRAFPYHFHHVNEELFLVIEGTGTVRTPAGEFPLGPWDLLCCPAGPEGAHQIANTGTTPLRYLALSTMQDPEVVEYPDSQKYGVVAGRPPGGRPTDAAFHAFAFKKNRVDYWEGED